ncbi:MAG: type II toxin-antitoxin system YafQ family toxin [Acinetobacter sp.]|jgi:mRNA interferase YafQ|nr:MAG: type II toxin-antitoxin system YafQ family toxin [Acinetobacter sp.]
MSARALILMKSFKKDIRKHYLHLATPEWAEVLSCLVSNLPLERKYQDHALTGEWKGFRDCHVKPDLVLIYKIVENDLELHHLDSHSEIFG